MPVTAAQLKALMPSATRPDDFAGPLNAAMARFEINTPLREAMFLAQLAHESGETRHLSENLNYSAQGLLNVFGKYFKTEAEAHAFERKPEQIANRVYANRLGNGDEASGDGWRYRGRGLIQLTGRQNYKDCGTVLQAEFVTNPPLLETPALAALSAAWFWNMKKLNPLADEGDVEATTRRINGGTNGLDERQAYYERAGVILGV